VSGPETFDRAGAIAALNAATKCTWDAAHYNDWSMRTLCESILTWTTADDPNSERAHATIAQIDAEDADANRVTLTRAEAHELVAAAAQLGALSYLAKGWELSGHWNDNAEWDADDFHQHVDDCASGDDARSNGPKDTDDSGLPEVALS
jgi:hypothetical protein